MYFFSKLPDDPQKDWPLEDLGEKIVSVIQQIKPHTVGIIDMYIHVVISEQFYRHFDN